VEKGKEEVIVPEVETVEGCEERVCGWDDDEDAIAASAAGPFL
jgi:hypothetical protein